MIIDMAHYIKATTRTMTKADILNMKNVNVANVADIANAADVALVTDVTTGTIAVVKTDVCLACSF